MRLGVTEILLILVLDMNIVVALAIGIAYTIYKRKKAGKEIAQ